jgi:NADPH:quinone reductase-like Zn-dependent oxidoreductase
MVESEEPSPGPREVLVRVRANSINFREVSVMRGTYPLPVKPDVVMGADGAGEVVALGEGVTRLKLGDRVAAAMFPRWIDGPFSWENVPQLGGSLDGMMCELVVLNEDALVRFPDHLSFEEAATLPCAAVTAWNALTGGRRLQAGDTVLTLGSGGVSLFALQLAKLLGARVIATTSNDEKAKRLLSLGADHVINYRSNPDWNVEVRELTGGRGVDQVIDIGGGTLEKSVKSTAWEGEVEFIGMLESGNSTLDIRTLYTSIAKLRVVAAGNRAQFIAMNRAISAAKMRPVIDRVFGFDELHAAFRYYEATQPLGKVVIRHATSVAGARESELGQLAYGASP